MTRSTGPSKKKPDSHSNDSFRDFVKGTEEVWGRDSSVGKAQCGQPRYRCSINGKDKGLFSTASRPALRTTEPPIQQVQQSISPGLSARGMKLTIHLHPIPGVVISPLPRRLHGVLFN
jgi:hypothetical protein